MTDHKTVPDLADEIDEELVAYLDGELDREASARVDRRLADDPQYRARLAQLQRAWDMLDTLQRTEADDSFTQSTVAMVALKAQEDVKADNSSVRKKRSLAWIGLAACVLAAAALGYSILHNRLSEPNRELVRDLPVIERVDEYRNVESVEFLQQLAREHLFAGEGEDAL